jgi:hypothetical protein
MKISFKLTAMKIFNVVEGKISPYFAQVEKQSLPSIRGPSPYWRVGDLSVDLGANLATYSKQFGDRFDIKSKQISL